MGRPLLGMSGPFQRMDDSLDGVRGLRLGVRRLFRGTDVARFGMDSVLRGVDRSGHGADDYRSPADSPRFGTALHVRERLVPAWLRTAITSTFLPEVNPLA